MADGDDSSSSLPPPAPRPCWAIRPWPCTRTTSATRICIGKTVILPLVDKEIPVVADDVCGQGIRHGRGEDHPRPRPQRLRGGRAPQPARRSSVHDGRRAHQRRTAANMTGMDRYEARKAIVADLEASGFLVQGGAAQAQCGHLLPLRHHGGAHGRASSGS